MCLGKRQHANGFITSPDGDIELYFSEAGIETSSMTKGQICKEIGATWFIDDVPKHCESALKGKA